MEFQRTFSKARWEEINGYCRALRAGNLVYLTGTAPISDDGSTHAPGDAYTQAMRCYAIIERALADLGAAKTDLVRTRMFVTDISRADEFGRAHKDFFGDHRPCLTMVGVASLISPDMLVEIEAEAVLG